MDISKIHSVRISPHASSRVMIDYFPTLDNEQLFHDVQVDSRDVEMSAGALCLYAATLLTKVYETSPQDIEFEASEREFALRDMIKNNPKYSNFTDEQVATMAHNLVLRDIRNCFAHGNFEISYDVHTQKLFYVLKPRRKDFVVDKPIIISKQALFNKNRLYIGRIGRKFSFLTAEQINHKLRTEFGGQLKDLILPVDMLKLAENYLDNKIKYRERYRPNENRYLLLYYPLLVSQMTYEQDEYYNLFNKDSIIFGKIAHVRNAISHNGFKFNDRTLDITHTDREEQETDPLEKSVRMLKLARDEKNLILWLQQKRSENEDISYYISEWSKNFFDRIFVDGGYEEEMQDKYNVTPQ